MKSLTAMYGGLEWIADIEQLINTCDLCQHHQKSPDKTLHGSGRLSHGKGCTLAMLAHFITMFLIVIDALPK